MKTAVVDVGGGLGEFKELEKQGKLLLIAPDDTCGIDTLTRDKKAMERFYEKGFQDGEKIGLFVIVRIEKDPIFHV